jgi:hypothetical protein
MKRKERLETQIAEVEARLGVAPVAEMVAGMATPRAVSSPTPHRLPPLSPLSPTLQGGGGKAAANEMEMLQQVRLCPVFIDDVLSAQSQPMSTPICLKKRQPDGMQAGTRAAARSRALALCKSQPCGSSRRAVASGILVVEV